jgi:uncharacterized protein YndB with AHSA1/START domain
MVTHPVRPIQVAAHIAAPPAEVFAFVSDTRNDPLWCDNVETVELVAGEDVGVGTRFRFHQHLERPGGERMQFDVEVEIVELEEHTSTWLATDRFQDRQIAIEVEPEGEGVEDHPGDPARIPAPARPGPMGVSPPGPARLHPAVPGTGRPLPVTPPLTLRRRSGSMSVPSSPRRRTRARRWVEPSS